MKELRLHFPLTNAGSGFARVFPDTLENSGTGYNYGLEVTLQRYFNKNWHALFLAVYIILNIHQAMELKETPALMACMQQTF